MEPQDWLSQQRNLYRDDPPSQTPPLAIHPVSGETETTDKLQSQFWWGGGASRSAWQIVERACQSHLTHICVLTFGPVQSFLAGGQRLRDWAVASWICHYLSAVLIHQWEESGGKVLFPLSDSVPLVQWLQGRNNGEIDTAKFWQAGLPNLIVGLHPGEENWLSQCKRQFNHDWLRFIQALQSSVAHFDTNLASPLGWQVIQRDCRYLWSLYGDSIPLRPETINCDLAGLYRSVEAQKLGRRWRGSWWGGRTSPSDGRLSIWHPGLKPIDRGGKWGLPDAVTNQWWQNLSEIDSGTFAGLFSESDRLNSIELVKRLASASQVIEPTLNALWSKSPPPPRCPWQNFPDRSAVAAAWVADAIDPDCWNRAIQPLHDEFFQHLPYSQTWGMPRLDAESPQLLHPRVLERRNLNQDQIASWQAKVPKGWESTIEWTVGWRGDADRMGEWLSGEQYRAQNLPWSKWHPDRTQIERYQLGIDPPDTGQNSRTIELPHMLDLSLLFNLWSDRLYPLVERHHHGKVIFAGGDDFLLLGPLTELVGLTGDLHRLWQGKRAPADNPEIEPQNPPRDGWANYQNQPYPVPGQKMTFSLGIVIAQRRIPQSLWHRGLNEAYKHAKDRGRNRVCVRVLFNSGQSLEWVCPWPLWHLLMSVTPETSDKTDLNRWEKLLFYLEGTRLKQEKASLKTVSKLLNAFWLSVGIPLTWQQIQGIINQKRQLKKDVKQWQWWMDWVSLRAFLDRQQRERQTWIEKMNDGEQS